MADANHNGYEAPEPIEVTIGKASITVTADSLSKTEGENDPELTYTFDGLIGDDKLTGRLTREVGENVGDYPIRQSTLSAGDNYTIAFTGATFMINAKSGSEPGQEPQPAPRSAPSGMLLATMVSGSNTSLKLSWTRISGADGYDIYFKYCDGKGNYPLFATVSGEGTTGYTFTGLAKNKSYKAYVRAWVLENGGKRYVLNSSPTVHAFTGNGTAKITNPGKLTLKKSTLKVKPGKTASFKASVKGIKKGKTVVTVTTANGKKAKVTITVK